MEKEQLSNENNRSIVVLYESGQVEELERFWRERPNERIDSFVVALSLDIEAKLRERNIVFSSGREYKGSSLDMLTTEDEMMTTFFADPRWSLFNYRNVPLPTTFRFMFRVYLQRVWYYSNLLISIIETHPSVKRLVLFAPSGIISKTFGGLAAREVKVVIDCAKTVATIRGISVAVIPLSLSVTSLRSSARPFFFMVQRTLFGLLLIVWNATIVVLRRSRRPCIVISDYWKNVGSTMELLNGGECIFLDRMEIRHINWRALLRYRMRFVHSENFISRDMRMRARESAQGFAEVWSDMRTTIAPVFVCRGYSFNSLLLNAVDDIINRVEKLLCEIEGTYALYTHLQPDVIILRASVSGQTHFSVLPLVAKNCGIPALELQHGLEYLGPGSGSREHTAGYIAAYGSLVKKELLSIGYAPEQVYEIGSPRFDSHRVSVATNIHRKFTVLCFVPDIRSFGVYDSYSAEDYFNAIARAVETITNVHVIIKLRSGLVASGFLRAIIASAFSGTSYTIAESKSSPDLFVQADVVVSGYSTVILEALQCSVPIIIFALNPINAMVIRFHFSQYSDAHALYIAYTQKEFSETLAELANNPTLRNSIRVKAQEFLTSNFCFDGNSSRRLAALITLLANRSVPATLR